MEVIYEQIGNYLVSCVDDKDTLTLMIDELMPLIKQVNYAAIDSDSLDMYTDKLGLGAQAQLILSNIVTIYKINVGMGTEKLLGLAGLNSNTIEAIQTNLNYAWVPAGILLMGSGIISNLREAVNVGTERSHSDRT